MTRVARLVLVWCVQPARAGRASFVDEAEELLSDAESIGLAPDVSMYSAAMQAVAHRAQTADDYQRVRRIHARMRAAGIPDNDVTRRILCRIPPLRDPR
jgi:hypothetical protein